MSLRLRVLAIVGLAAVAPADVLAQQHDHRPTGRAVGDPLPLATTCRPQVAGLLDRGLHQVHTMAFDDAVGTFRQAAHSDIDCAMAYWGVALAHWGRFARSGRAEVLAEGWRALDQAALVQRTPSARERRYLDALVGRYRDRRGNGPAGYAAAMAQLADDFTTDPHAALLSALAAAETAATGPAAVAAGRAALDLVSRPAVPSAHPVALYYAVLAGDRPELAATVLARARALADAADAPGILRRAPVRTFARLGRWDEALAVARRAAAAARDESIAADELAALDLEVYALLQAGRSDEARVAARRLDDRARDGSGDADTAVRAAIAARLALDANATATAPFDGDGAAPPPVRLFVRAVNAAAAGRAAEAALAARLLADAWPSPGIEEARLVRAAAAWAAFAAGRRAAAVAEMSELADEEDGGFRGPFAAPPLRPAREQLGDLLMAAARPDEAATAYREVLRQWPGRHRASIGLRGALRASGRTP